MRLPIVLALAASTVTAGLLRAQQAAAIKKAAETILPEDVGRHIRVIADDSMKGRNTPSPGLEMTARYIADQFKRLGLKPAGDSGSWIQRYPIPRNAAASAPNTVGILEGSDPQLKNEYIVLSAHMDHIGVGGGGADSIFNGADDDGSGTAGIVELAEAFSQPGARPRRSLIFLAVSGEEKGMWGSNYFATHPPVPLKQIVANLNFDMIGRWITDTVLVIGLEHSDLGATFDRVKAGHPELGIAAIPNPPPGRLYSSDHYSFARRGVPIIKFGGPSAGSTDYHKVGDAPDKIDVAREVKILRFAFYLGQEVANVDQRPRWNPESYRTIVKD